MRLKISVSNHRGEMGSSRVFEDIRELDENVKSIIDWIKSKFSKEEIKTRIMRRIVELEENNLRPKTIMIDDKFYDNFEKPYFGKVKIYGLDAIPVCGLNEDFIIGV